MGRLPKTHYIFILLILVLILTGCELRRDEGQSSDTAPVGDLAPPTLAPLGSDSSEVSVEQASGAPTVVNAEPTATTSTLRAGEANENVTEPVAPTSQPAVDLSSEATNNSPVEEAAVEPESFVPPAEQVKVEAAAVAEPAAQVEPTVVEPIIVDATSEELPSGGPIAANPPASATTGDYAASISSDGTHMVQSGDTLFSLSLRYGTTVEALMLANGLTSELIYEGQVLNVAGYDGTYAPPTYTPALPGSNNGNHVVAPGETLFSIATRYGTSVAAVAGANGIPYPHLIYPGQQLIIPGSTDNTYYVPPGNSGYYPQTGDSGYYPPSDNTYVNPSGLATHVVAPGETLYSIAQRYGLSPQSIAVANGLVNPNQIAAGQVLTLP